jgi:hypothetical protein
MKNQTFHRLVLSALLLLSLSLIEAKTQIPNKGKTQRKVTTVSPSQNEQLYLNVKGEFKKLRFTGYNYAGQKAFSSEWLSGTSVRWPIENEQGQPLIEGAYFLVMDAEMADGEVGTLYFMVLLTGAKVELIRSDELAEKIPRDEQVAFFRVAVGVVPQQASLWLGYGWSLYDPESQVIFLNPNETPAQQKAGNKQRQKEESAKLQMMQLARKAFKQALELSDDCELRLEAMSGLSQCYVMLDDIGRAENYLHQQLDLPCAPSEHKAWIYYLLAVNEWSTAHQLSQRYDNPAKVKQNPFHWREFKDENDRQKFNHSVEQGLKYIDLSLRLKADDTDALAYKSLLLREKQKATPDAATWTVYDQEARRLVDSAARLSHQQARPTASQNPPLDGLVALPPLSKQSSLPLPSVKKVHKGKKK